jgi:hypothetical protein
MIAPGFRISTADRVVRRINDHLQLQDTRIAPNVHPAGDGFLPTHAGGFFLGLQAEKKYYQSLPQTC